MNRRLPGISLLRVMLSLTVTKLVQVVAWARARGTPCRTANSQTRRERRTACAALPRIRFLTCPYGKVPFVFSSWAASELKFWRSPSI